MSNSGDTAFVRWQATAIAQLGHANNLLLGLAGGGLAFSVDLLVEETFDSRNAAGGFLMGATIVLLVSVLSGLACVLTRLYDFRTTAKIARGKEKQHPEKELNRHRKKSRTLGSWTWGLLWSQILSFGIGACLLAVAVATQVLL